MQLPIDVGAVLRAATDIDAARATPISVSIYIDGSAPGNIIGYVRGAFASTAEHTKVTISYLDDTALSIREDADMAVIVAGFSEDVGSFAATVRSKGIPVMVVTTLPSLVNDMAAAEGNPIPDGDIVSPEEIPSPAGEVARGAIEKVVGAISSRKDKNAGSKDASGNGVALDAEGNYLYRASYEDDPIPLDELGQRVLNTRMGGWILETCAKKKLAFALSFPFMRKPLSLDSVKATSLENAAVGLVAFIPGADLPIMTLNQAKMMLQIAAAYGEPLNIERVKELACVVGGAFVCRGVARQLASVVPALGWAVKAAVGFTGTQAMGHAAIEYFEAGGDITGVAHVIEKARDGVVEAAGNAVNSSMGQKALASVKGAASSVVGKITGKVSEQGTDQATLRS